MTEAPNKSSFAVTKGAIDVSAISLNSCPYLASTYDHATPLAYPHSSNRCLRHKTVLERQLQFQSAYCLSDCYTDCYIFQQEGEKFAIKTYAEEQQEEGNSSKYTIPVILILVTLVVFISLFFIGMNIQKVTAFDMPLKMGFGDKTKSDQSHEEIQPVSPADRQDSELRPDSHMSNLEIAPADEALPTAESSAAESQPGDNDTKGSFRAIDYANNADH